VIDATKILRSGRRYRGFLSVNRFYVPVTMTLYPVDSKTVRIRHLFPTSLVQRVKKGTVIFILIEDERSRIGEIRVVGIGEKEITGVLDFVSEDRRKLPRVKVDGILDIPAVVQVGKENYRGRVVDISLVSVGVSPDMRIVGDQCTLTLSFKGIKTALRGRIRRSEDGFAVIEVEGNGDMVDLLSRVYSELFLSVQRNLQS